MKENLKLVELTQLLSPGMPTWTGSCGFHLEIKCDYDRDFRVQQLKMMASAGTHMDAPSHRFQDAPSIHALALEQFIVPACVIDVSKKASANYEISAEDIQNYEQAYGRLPKNALVIGYTGWSRFWSDPKAYRNADSKGQMHFPIFSEASAELLLTREIAGIGIDTLSPDRDGSSYPVHKLILGAGKYIIENVADCSTLPPKGAYVIALPLRAHDASESPIRMVGFY